VQQNPIVAHADTFFSHLAHKWKVKISRRVKKEGRWESFIWEIYPHPDKNFYYLCELSTDGTENFFGTSFGAYRLDKDNFPLQFQTAVRPVLSDILLMKILPYLLPHNIFLQLTHVGSNECLIAISYTEKGPIFMLKVMDLRTVKLTKSEDNNEVVVKFDGDFRALAEEIIRICVLTAL